MNGGPGPAGGRPLAGQQLFRPPTTWTLQLEHAGLKNLNSQLPARPVGTGSALPRRSAAPGPGGRQGLFIC